MRARPTYRLKGSLKVLARGLKLACWTIIPLAASIPGVSVASGLEVLPLIAQLPKLSEGGCVFTLVNKNDETLTLQDIQIFPAGFFVADLSTHHIPPGQHMPIVVRRMERSIKPDAPRDFELQFIIRQTISDETAAYPAFLTFIDDEMHCYCSPSALFVARTSEGASQTFDIECIWPQGKSVRVDKIESTNTNLMFQILSTNGRNLRFFVEWTGAVPDELIQRVEARVVPEDPQIKPLVLILNIGAVVDMVIHPLEVKIPNTSGSKSALYVKYPSWEMSLVDIAVPDPNVSVRVFPESKIPGSYWVELTRDSPSDVGELGNLQIKFLSGDSVRTVDIPVESVVTLSGAVQQMTHAAVQRGWRRAGSACGGCGRK